MRAAVIIVGKGIAGLTLAVLLRRKDIDCVVLDRPMGRKYFPLAETLPPSSIPLLRDLGLLEVFESGAIRKTFGYHSLWGSNTVIDHNFYALVASKHGLKIDKQSVVEGLEVLAQARIVDLGGSRVHGIQADDSGIVVELVGVHGAQTIRGSIVVDATGRSRSILRRLGISAQHRDDLISFSCHLPKMKHPKLTHEVYVESFESGWGIVSGLNEKTNVMSLFTRKGHAAQARFTQYDHWREELSETVYLKDFLTGPGNATVVGAHANSSKAEVAAGGGWLAVGDAALAFDPLSSHGIANAVYTARLAADTIESALTTGNGGALGDYSDTVSAIFDEYQVGRNRLYRQERRWIDAPFWSDDSFRRPQPKNSATAASSDRPRLLGRPLPHRLGVE